MLIADNIIRQNLKNVFFLCGDACGGKTTMAKLIEKKYGFLRYPADNYADVCKVRLDPKYQQALLMDGSEDWYSYYAQPPEDYSRYMESCAREVAEYVIVDLIKLSQNQKVVADVIIPVEILQEIAEPSQVVLLFAPIAIKRKEYFGRSEKAAELSRIRSLPDSDFLLENTLNALVYNDELKFEAFLNSGFRYIQRSENNDTVDQTLRQIEEHFRLSDSV